MQRPEKVWNTAGKLRTTIQKIRNKRHSIFGWSYLNLHSSGLLQIGFQFASYSWLKYLVAWDALALLVVLLYIRKNTTQLSPRNSNAPSNSSNSSAFQYTLILKQKLHCLKVSYCSSSFGRLKGLAAWRTVVSWCSHLLWRHGPLKIRAYETWHPGGASGPCSWVHWSYRQWSLLCMDFISLLVWVLSKVGTVLLIGRQEYEDAVWRHECKGYASSIQKVAWQMKTCPPLAGEGGDRMPESNPSARNQWTRTNINLNSILHNCLRLFPGLGSLHDSEDCAVESEVHPEDRWNGAHYSFPAGRADEGRLTSEQRFG